jgi:hypothetical protein
MFATQNHGKVTPRKGLPQRIAKTNHMIRPTVAFMICLALAACEKDEQTEKSAAKTIMDADALLLKDIEQAGPELEKRLMAGIRIQDGLIIVQEPPIGFYVLPANSPWMLSCGIGISVVFGSSVNGDSTSVGNEVELHLARSFISQKDCGVIGPRLGKRLKSALQDEQVLR